MERPGRGPLASFCLAKGWRLFRQRRFLLWMHFLCAQGGDVSVPEAREGQARCLARHNSRRRSELASLLQLLLKGVSTCKQLPARELWLDAASQLWSHLTAWDWTSSNVDVCDEQESVCNPSIFLPPIPLCLPAWDESLMCSYWHCLWVTHSSCWREQNKHSSKAQAETKSRIVYAAEIFSI